jgi:hypothetical protein
MFSFVKAATVPQHIKTISKKHNQQRGHMRKSIIAVALIFFVAVSLYASREATAVPAFARQTGMACNTCHFQHFPALNQFGREFKAGGYRLMGSQSLVEGDFLSIPSTLNATLVTKTRYVKTYGANDATGTNRGQFDFPDEAALFLAGRVSERIGFTLEAQMSDETSKMFASFKMPVNVYNANGTRVEIIPFTTDAAGASFGFELLNTGAMRMSRVLEHRNDISAQQYIGTATAAQGAAFVLYNAIGYINYSLWQTEVGSSSGEFLSYIRAAATRQYNGWDLGGGIQWWGGTAADNANTTDYEADAFALDFQAQGTVGGKYPLGVYLTYAVAGKNEAGGTTDVFNTTTDTIDDNKAWSILAELGVIPNRATVALAYRSGETGATAANNEQTAITLGGTYLLAQNFELQVNHSIYDGNFYDTNPADGDRKTTLMIFAAF